MCYSALVEADLKRLSIEYGFEAFDDSFSVLVNRNKTDPKRHPLCTSRVFPGSYTTPVVRDEVDNGFVVLPMRYNVYVPENIQQPSKYTSYNARKDNLNSRFWSDAFCVNHGFVLVKAFYEWVEVKDLIKAGTVKIEDVENQFSEQLKTKKEKAEAMAKKFVLTSNDKKPAVERKTIIQFSPSDGGDVVVPIIYNVRKLEDGFLDYGFAIVTDEPTSEVLNAGHDRSPVVLSLEDAKLWSLGKKLGKRQLEQILQARKKVFFNHRLAVS